MAKKKVSGNDEIKVEVAPDTDHKFGNPGKVRTFTVLENPDADDLYTLHEVVSVLKGKPVTQPLLPKFTSDQLEAYVAENGQWLA